MTSTHVIVLPGGGYAEYSQLEGVPVVEWLNDSGVDAGMLHYPLHQRHPIPLEALRSEIARHRRAGVSRIGLMGFSAGGHLAGLAALSPDSNEEHRVDFAVLGYSITSMETETYRPSRLILLGEDATPELRRSTSLDRLVTADAPPFFLWHTAEDPTSRRNTPTAWPPTLARHHVPHTVHVFAHGPHSLALAHGAGEAETWTAMALRWIAGLSGHIADVTNRIEEFT